MHYSELDKIADLPKIRAFSRPFYFSKKFCLSSGAAGALTPRGAGPEYLARAKAPPGAGPESSSGAKAPPGAGPRKKCRGEAPPGAGSEKCAGAAGPAGAYPGPRSSLVISHVFSRVAIKRFRSFERPRPTL